MQMTRVFQIGESEIKIIPVENTEKIMLCVNGQSIILDWKEAKTLSKAILSAAQEADPWAFVDPSSR